MKKEKIIQIVADSGILLALTNWGRIFVRTQDGKEVRWEKMKIPKELNLEK